jgi:uncharacterized protein (DUF488 family)
MFRWRSRAPASARPYPHALSDTLATVRVFTIGHGTRPVEELVECLDAAAVETLVDVRRYPGSRRNPQFNQDALAETLAKSNVAYRHAVELGGRRSGEAGEERFTCIGAAAFRSYAARMGSPEWQRALSAVLDEPTPCLMCAETVPWRCHRMLISELLTARGHEVLHLLRPHDVRPHRLSEDAEVREGKLYLCGELVA